jgi:hypothetical protein
VSDCILPKVGEELALFERENLQERFESESQLETSGAIQLDTFEVLEEEKSGVGQKAKKNPASGLGGGRLSCDFVHNFNLIGRDIMLLVAKVADDPRWYLSQRRIITNTRGEYRTPSPILDNKIA